MRSTFLTCCLALVLGTVSGCASTKEIAADHCEIEVLRLVQWRNEPGKFDVTYEVKGAAGAIGQTWVAAQVHTQRWITGDYVEVGPGAFQTELEIRLTGRPQQFSAVLKVGDHRCKVKAPHPDPFPYHRE